MGKRLRPESWAEIRRRYIAGEPAKRIAREFGISDGAVYKRSARDSWPAPVGGSYVAEDVDLVGALSRLERIMDRFEGLQRDLNDRIDE
ncbi:MAG: hypothetical protein EPN57_08670 [Paraburkholderia sp.]|nr:MAG: hypothetical protein EPN57_08670 [Paraburkholderia sp.]